MAKVELKFGELGGGGVSYFVLSGIYTKYSGSGYTNISCSSQDTTLMDNASYSDNATSKTFTLKRAFKGKMLFAYNNRSTVPQIPYITINGTNYNAESGGNSSLVPKELNLPSGTTITYNIGTNTDMSTSSWALFYEG